MVQSTPWWYEFSWALLAVIRRILVIQVCHACTYEIYIHRCAHNCICIQFIQCRTFAAYDNTCIMFAEWNPILDSYWYCAYSKNSAWFAVASHIFTQNIMCIFFIFLFFCFWHPFLRWSHGFSFNHQKNSHKVIILFFFMSQVTTIY